jgi:hypothetical protein
MDSRWVAGIEGCYGKSGPERECCLTYFAYSISPYTKPRKCSCENDHQESHRRVDWSHFLEIMLMVLDYMISAQSTALVEFGIQACLIS